MRDGQGAGACDTARTVHGVGVGLVRAQTIAMLLVAVLAGCHRIEVRRERYCDDGSSLHQPLVDCVRAATPSHTDEDPEDWVQACRWHAHDVACKWRWLAVGYVDAGRRVTVPCDLATGDYRDACINGGWRE